MFSPFGFGGYGLFSIMFMIVFVTIAGAIIFTIIKGIGTWSHNNGSPLLTVNAKVVGKRVDTRVSHSMHGTESALRSTSTFHTYYVTFEVESGDRMELEVPENEYGYMIEGDNGRLSFKGTRYMGFRRDR